VKPETISNLREQYDDGCKPDKAENLRVVLSAKLTVQMVELFEDQSEA
jgi:hypothetical protein